MDIKRFRWWLLACIKALLLKIPFLNKSFVILSSGRSGSTMLTQLLNCHWQIQCSAELLNRRQLIKYQLKKTDSDCLIDYILAMLLPWTPWLPFTGFKLFNEQLEFCKLSLQQLLRALCSPPVIVLYRENLLETFVSLKIAFQNDVWYSETSVNECSIEVDWDEFKEYAETERKRWKESMSSLAGVRKIFVSYEELTAEREKTMNNVFTFLNVQTCPVSVQSKRQNPLPLEKKIVNYQEILSKAKTSNFPMYLTASWLKNALN